MAQEISSRAYSPRGRRAFRLGRVAGFARLRTLKLAAWVLVGWAAYAYFFVYNDEERTTPYVHTEKGVGEGLSKAYRDMWASESLYEYCRSDFYYRYGQMPGLDGMHWMLLNDHHPQDAITAGFLFAGTWGGQYADDVTRAIEAISAATGGSMIVHHDDLVYSLGWCPYPGEVAPPQPTDKWAMPRGKRAFRQR